MASAPSVLGALFSHGAWITDMAAEFGLLVAVVGALTGLWAWRLDWLRRAGRRPESAGRRGGGTTDGWFEAQPNAMLVLDEHGRVEWANRAATATCGGPDRPLVGAFCWSIGLEIGESWWRRHVQSLEAGAALRAPARCIGPDDLPRWVELAWSAFEEDGSRRILLQVTDVTEARFIHAELHASQERLQLALEGAELGTWDIDHASGRVEINDRFAAMLGFALDQIADVRGWWNERVHPADRRRVLRAYAAHLRGKSPRFDEQYRLRSSSGDWIWVLSRGRTVAWDDRGRVLRVAGTHLNVTEQRESELRFRQLFDQMLDGFALHEVILNGAGEPVDYRWLTVNPAFERMTGLSRSRVVGRRALEVLPDLEPMWIETFGRVALTGTPARTTAYVRSLGAYFDVVVFSPRRLQFAVTFENVTERVEAQDRRQLLTRELNHRVKNTLATANALLSLTRRGATDLESFVSAYEQRLSALTMAHEALAARHWADVWISEIVERVRTAFAPPGADRLLTFGEDLLLPMAHVQPVAMALQELATNAVKHGAFADGAGVVRVGWRLEQDGVVIDWIERCSRPLSERAVEAFGSAASGAGSPGRATGGDRLGQGLTLLRGLIEHQAGGRLHAMCEEPGVRVTMWLPLQPEATRSP